MTQTAVTSMRFACRRRTAAGWTTSNEVLYAGEIGVETDTRKFKFGDGTTAWNSLLYAGGGSSGGAAWGGITGDLDDQLDLKARFDLTVPTSRTVNGHALSANVTLSAADVGADASGSASSAQAYAVQRANHTGTQAQSTITNLVSDLAAKADLVGGVVPSSQIPAIAITEYLGSVSSQAAMLALSGQKGDWAIRSDLSMVYIITGNDPTQLSDWTGMAYPTAPVLSVNGLTGAVTLAKSDIGLGNVENTALSTWAGSSNLTTLGTIATGVWQGTAVGVSYGGTGATSQSAARTNLGLAIGSDVQAYSAQLASLAGLSYAGNGTKAIRLNSGETAFEFFAPGTAIGPGASVTDNAITAFDGTGGYQLQQRSVTISDVSGNSLTMATIAGCAFVLQATLPTQSASAQAGVAAQLIASDAIAGSSNAGAAAGAAALVRGGSAKRLTSGNANGGGIDLDGGLGIGSGINGQVRITNAGTAASPSLSWTGALGYGLYLESGVLVGIVAGGAACMYFGSSSNQIRLPTQFNSGNAGNNRFYGNTRSVTASTAGSGAPRAMIIDDSGTVFTNEGSSAKNYHSLPTAVANLHAEWIVQDADGIRIVAAAGDTIRVKDKVTATAGYIESTTIGSIVRLVCINATEWIAMEIGGTWTDGTFTYDDTGLTTP